MQLDERERTRCPDDRRRDGPALPRPQTGDRRIPHPPCRGGHAGRTGTTVIGGATVALSNNPSLGGASNVITALPPVVMFTTASHPALIAGKIPAQCAGSAEGRPVSGWRACRCRIVAPASAALEALAGLDPDELTPKQALEALYRLKRLR